MGQSTGMVRLPKSGIDEDLTGRTHEEARAREGVVLAIGTFPPPFNGQSKNMELIVADIERSTAVRTIRLTMSGGGLTRTAGHFARKGGRAFRALTVILGAAGERSKILYIVADGGSGLILTTLLVSFARLAGFRVVVQHRTFAYFERPKRLMKIVNRLIGESGLHVFLTTGSAERFFRVYRPVRGYLVNHNLSQFPAFWSTARRIPRVRYRDGHLRVGYLSNLIREKGFDVFLRVVDRAAAEKLPLKFVIAGPAPGPEEEAEVHAAVERHRDRLEYVGALYGDDKIRFYRRLDIFLFPTRYPYEAQPNVLLEALCCSCAVITNDRGCIKEDLGEVPGSIVIARQDQSDPEAFLKALVTLQAAPERLTRMRAMALVQTRARLNEARKNYNDFIKLFVR